ncbi:hypothetical protein BAMA111019_16285 [Bacillus manliponensis]
MNLRVKVKKIREDSVKPHYTKKGDAGFDLGAMEDAVIIPGGTKVIPIGLAFEISPGREMTVRPRSGISKRTMLHVSLGTIDSSFRGGVGVIVKNLKPPMLLTPAAEGADIL